MYVSASKNQAKSVSGMTKQQTTGYEELQKAIADFTLNTPFLTGKAYDTSKSFFSVVLYPLSQGGILLSEAVEKAVTKFPEEYQARVDSGNLKQSVLEEKIRGAERLLGQAEEIRTMLESSLMPDILKASQLASNLRLLESYSNIKKILEEKLDKLMTFNHNSPRIFEEIQALEDAINQGLAQTTTAFNPDTGMFTIPPKEALGWSKTINEKWKAKEQEQADLAIKKANEEKNAFEKDMEGRTYKFVEVHGARMWLWVKDPSKVTQDDIEFNERYKLFFDGEAEKYGIKNVHKKEQEDDWLTTISHELSTGINAITGEPLNAIEKFQRWNVLVSTFSTSLVGAYWTVKLTGPTKVKPKQSEKELNKQPGKTKKPPIVEEIKLNDVEILNELKKVPDLTRTQAKTIENATNIINDHLTDMDFSGTLRDLKGNPVPKPGGGFWNHLQEMKDSYRGLVKTRRSLDNSLKNPNLTPSAKLAIEKTLDIINSNIKKIEDLFKPFGGIE